MRAVFYTGKLGRLKNIIVTEKSKFEVDCKSPMLSAYRT